MILEATDIRKYYGGFCALNGIDIGINEGEFVSIIGPNGAGKTTLINVITGFLKPDTGQVRFKGKEITGKGPQAVTRIGIARSFQLVHIFPELSVIDTIKVAILSRDGKGRRFFANLAKDKKLHEQAMEVAELFGLTDQLEEKSKNLPQGAKKLMDVASAFALHPEIILLFIYVEYSDSSTVGKSFISVYGRKRPATYLSINFILTLNSRYVIWSAISRLLLYISFERRLRYAPVIEVFPRK